MKKFFFCLFCFLGILSITHQLRAQSMYFGLEGGPTIAYQNWNGYQESNPLLAMRIMAHLESYGSESAFFLNAGLNPKGRGLRFNDYVSPITGNVVRGGYSKVVFKNAEVLAGIKRYYEWGENFEVFYSFGLRLIYTYDTELGNMRYFNPNAIRKWNYGASVGGGIRLKSNEFFRPSFHVSFSPDLSQQIQAPPQEIATPTGDRYTMPKQEIRNMALEIGVTLQFLRKVVYD